MISAHRKPSDGAVLATSPSICFLALGPSPQCVVKTIKLTSRFVTDLLGTAFQRWACDVSWARTSVTHFVSQTTQEFPGTSAGSLRNFRQSSSWHVVSDSPAFFLPAQKRTEDKSHMFTLSPNTLALKLRQQISTHHRSDTYFRTQIIDKRLDRAIAHVVHHIPCSYVLVISV